MLSEGKFLTPEAPRQPHRLLVIMSNCRANQPNSGWTKATVNNHINNNAGKLQGALRHEPTY